jgi:hypothetical protein
VAVPHSVSLNKGKHLGKFSVLIRKISLAVVEPNRKLVWSLIECHTSVLLPSVSPQQGQDPVTVLL